MELKGLGIIVGEGKGKNVRSMRSSLSGRCSRPRFRESVARWRSSSRAAAWRALRFVSIYSSSSSP